MANVNMGALLLTGFVIVGGAMIGGISRLLSGGSFIEIAGNLPWLRSGTKKQKCEIILDYLKFCIPVEYFRAFM